MVDNDEPDASTGEGVESITEFPVVDTTDDEDFYEEEDLRAATL